MFSVVHNHCLKGQPQIEHTYIHTYIVHVFPYSTENCPLQNNFLLNIPYLKADKLVFYI